MFIDMHFKPHLNDFAYILRHHYDTYRLHTITFKRCQESWDISTMYQLCSDRLFADLSLYSGLAAVIVMLLAVSDADANVARRLGVR